MNWTDPILIGALAGAALTGLSVGFSVGRKGSNRKDAEAAQLSADLARMETRTREQARTLNRLQNDQASTSGLFRRLPEVVRELNSSDLETPRISALLLSLAQDIFQAEQILLYLVPNPGAEEERGEELNLFEHRGSNPPESARKIRVGEGRLGFAAETRVEWVTEDWLNLSRTEARRFADNHPSLRADLIGPLVHHTRSGSALLGLLTIGLPENQAHPKDAKRLLQLVTGLGSIALMNARRVNELSAKANHDGLTGLLNKRHFMVELGAMIHRAESENQPLGIFIFDIDHFKKYNDTNGHLKGDELLKAMAALIKSNVRPGDRVGRYGGEEFLVAMPRADRDGALALAERLRQVIETHRFEHGEKQPLGRITVSGGVAAFPHDGTQSGELIHGADLALYEAKRGGRNRVLPYRQTDIGDAAPSPSPESADASLASDR